MYLQIDEELKEKILKATDVNYEWLGDFLPIESFIPLIKDLLYEVDKRDEAIENFKENYKPKTAAEIYGE